MAVREHALHQRVITEVDVTDDSEPFARCDIGLVVCRDLKVDRMKRCVPPGRHPIGEDRRGALADGRGIRISEDLREASLELSDLVRQFRGKLHDRSESLHQDGQERTAPAGWQRPFDHPPADLVHPAAIPAPGLEQHLKRRGDLVK